MKVAFWTVTRGAGNIAKEYTEKLLGKMENIEIDVFTMKKFEVENTIQMEDFTKEITEKFNEYDGHIFIMASGIVIRKISGLLKSKDIDPAVLLMDEGKHFVISLLSGHLGGANELTQEVAGILNLIPIITTSSDITGKIAVDTISQKINGELESLKSAKDVTSLIVDGKKVNLLLPQNVKIENNGNSDGIILATNRKNLEITKIIPKNIVIGIGCRRGIEKEHIIERLKWAFDNENLEIKGIKKAASAWVKADEIGLLEAMEEMNIPIEFFEKEQIQEIEHLIEDRSEYVKKTIGVYGVSEPCAYLASAKNGEFLAKKIILDGVTLSIYEEKNIEIME